MRARYVLLSLCLSLLTQNAAATEEEELPELELLGFIADFSDDEEGWVDPQQLEELFSLGGETEEPGENLDERAIEEGSTVTNEPDINAAAE